MSTAPAIAVRAQTVAAFAHDPARERLVSATATCAGVLGSALVTMVVIDALHADAALLAAAVFFSLQAGNAVQDHRATSRLVTTALLLPTVIGATALAAVLSGYRPALIGVFVVMAGAAIWIRQFGPRASAIGLLAFISYFFALFMQVTPADLLVTCTVGAIAVSTQLVARAVLLGTRPRRQITVLLREMRAASSLAVHRASSAERPRMLRGSLARIDEVAQAIRSWQHTYRTSEYLSCSEEDLEALVLDARVNLESACYELARRARSPLRDSSPALQRMRDAIAVVLAEDSTVAEIDNAVTAAQQLDAPGVPDTARMAAVLLARSVVVNAHLRTIVCRPRRHPHRQRVGRACARHRRSPSARDARTAPRIRMTWGHSERLAVQAMLAAAIAASVGEAISATRWYWAVLTAFVVFVGATTRGGILTRAYRRVIGTAIGIAVGLGAVALVHDDPRFLIAICVVGAFGMLYFGPLNYLYSALFVTIMLVAIYAMLGVLNQNVLDLRLVETVTGAIVGVLCTYLVLSSSSRPTLSTKIHAYADDLDGLLAAASAALSTTGDGTGLRARLTVLETSQTDLDRTISEMSTVFLFANRRRETETVHLMYVITRSAAAVVQTIDSDGLGARPRRDEPVIEAIAQVRVVAAMTLLTVTRQTAYRAEDIPRVAAIDSDTHAPASLAFFAVLRMGWALQKVDELWTSGSPR